jgi:photosystem II stability/assembly factor-like uncharacterized protein
MKKIFHILILILLAGAKISSAQPGWTSQNPYPTDKTMYDVYFTSATTGYMAGTSGKAFKTTNGGTNWSVMSGLGTAQLNSVYFFNTSTGYISGNTGVIYKTTDAGANWTLQTTGITKNINDVHFTDANNGAAASTGGTILSTTNGGTNWFTQSTADTGSINVVWLISSTVRFAGGNSGVFKTTNGGTNWVSVFNSGRVNSLYSISSTTVIASGYNFSDFQGKVFRTTDAGGNWDIISTGSQELLSVSFFNATTGITRGKSSLFRTTNGGVNWSSTFLGLLNDFKSVNCVNAGTAAYMVGSEGVIVKTTNSGTNWVVQSASSSLSSVFFLNANTGTAVGNNGTVLRTTNAGTNWIAQTSGVTSSLGEVYFTDANTGTAVGDLKTILRTTNGGTSWVSQSTSGSESYVSVFFSNASTGTITGSSGSILRTTNGGTNWIAQTSGTTNTLNSVFFTDVNTGFAAGNALILKTTNGGTNWISTSFTGKFFYNLYFTNANTGTAVGSSGVIYRTTDAGANWEQQTSGVTTSLNSVFFADANNGMIAGAGGIILYTWNGGSTWESQTVSSVALNSLFMSSLTATVVGLNGVIYRSDGVLPVELSSFTSSVNKQNVKLNWSTAMEENNSGFEIERKKESGDFIKLLFIEGKGNSNSENHYSYEDRNLTTGKYKYRLKQIDYNGNYKYYDLQNEVVIGTPDKFALMQNYPNPFNPVTRINYELPITNYVSIKIFDISGREVAQLVNEVKAAGYYSVTFDAKNLSSGTYFYKLQTENFNDVKRMIVLK